MLTALAAVCALSSACATPTMKLAPERLSALPGKSVISVDDRPVPLTHMTPAMGMAGAFGALIMEGQAEVFTRDHEIVDPAPAMETRIKATLARLGSGDDGGTLDLRAQGTDAAYPKKPGALLVDARTTYRHYIYLPFDWGHYQVLYKSVTRLVDGDTGEVHGQHECFRRAYDDGKNAPTEEQLLLNGSELLNSVLVGLADLCAGDFETEVLGVGG